MAFIIIGALLVIIVPYVISTYNRLVSEKLKVENQWSQIDIVLKQRFDTIPNLVSVVSGFAAHEKELFENITRARSRYLSSDTAEEAVQTASELSGMMTKLFAVAENYPELKSNANYMDLQKKLAGLEEKIADFRQFYNDTVMRYNRQILMFPSSIIAKIFGFAEKPFFNVEETDKAMPEVHL